MENEPTAVAPARDSCGEPIGPQRHTLKKCFDGLDLEASIEQTTQTTQSSAHSSRPESRPAHR